MKSTTRKIANVVSKHIDEGTDPENNLYIEKVVKIITKAMFGQRITIDVASQ